MAETNEAAVVPAAAPVEKPKRARDIREEEERARARKTFADHVATYREMPLDSEGNNVLWLLTWAKPGTNNCRIDYICHRGALAVTGDLGEAVYEWSNYTTPGFLAGCDLSYFHGKCQASRAGRRYNEWCEKEAREALEYHFRNNGGGEYDGEDGYKLALEEWTRERDEARAAAVEDEGGVWEGDEAYAKWNPPPTPPTARAKFEEEDGWDAISSADEWQEFVHGLSRFGGDDEEKIFGGDAWEWVYGIGSVIDWQCHFHLLGIKMAVAQLRERGELPKEEP